MHILYIDLKASVDKQTFPAGIAVCSHYRSQETAASAPQQLPLDSLKAELENKFPPHPFDNQANGFQVNTRFLISTDDCKSLLHQLNYLSEADRDKNLVVIIGEGSVLSLAKYISRIACGVIFIDIDSEVHTHIQHQVNCILENQEIPGFKTSYAKYFTNHQKLPEKTNLKNENDFYAQQGTQDESFLASQLRYEKAREAIKALKFIYVNANIANCEETSFIGKCIENSKMKVNLINLTNVHQYATRNKGVVSTEGRLNYAESISFLVNEKTQVMFSAETPLLSQMVLIKEYFKRLAEESLNNISKYYGYPSRYEKPGKEWEKYTGPF